MALGDYPIDFELFGKLSVTFSTDIFAHEDGTEKRLNLTPLGTRTFEGRHIALTNAERDTLEAFFDTKKGRLTTFDFGDPVTGVTHTVRFLDPKLNFKRRDDTRWDLIVRFKEVL